MQHLVAPYLRKTSRGHCCSFLSKPVGPCYWPDRCPHSHTGSIQPRVPSGPGSSTIPCSNYKAVPRPLGSLSSHQSFDLQMVQGVRGKDRDIVLVGKAAAGGQFEVVKHEIVIRQVLSEPLDRPCLAVSLRDPDSVNDRISTSPRDGATGGPWILLWPNCNYVDQSRTAEVSHRLSIVTPSACRR
jgi:hypothetical protein